MDLSTVTMSDFDALGMQLISIEEKIDSLTDQIKALNEEKKNISDKIIFIMSELKKTSYQVGDRKLLLRERTSVRTPKTEEDKLAFFSWLRGKGVEMQYLTVNSQAVNSLYKAERDAAIERGDLDFKIPGIGEESIYRTLSLRK